MLLRGLIRGLLRGLKRGLGISIGGGWGFRLVTEGGSTANATSYLTGSVDLVAGRLYVLSVTTSHGTTAETPNSVTGAGLTWNPVTGGAGSVPNSLRRTSTFYAHGSGAGSGQLTISFAGTMTGLAWSLVEVSGGKLQAPRQATTANANSTTITGALVDPLANSAHLYALGRAVLEGANLPAAGGWTELSDYPGASWDTPNGVQQTAYAIGDASADPTWPTSGQVVIVDLELEAA